MKRKNLILSFITLVLCSCSQKGNVPDASGAFEAVEVMVSAESNGIITKLYVQEGAELLKDTIACYIDSIPLSLVNNQIIAQEEALKSRKPDVETQLLALNAQLKQAEHEYQRLLKLFSSQAATPKQIDDATSQIEILKYQIKAQESILEKAITTINKESQPLNIQSKQVEYNLSKCKIKNPISGTVLAKYMEEGEMAIAGRPIYKIADLSKLTLRAYTSSSKLSLIKLNQKVIVLVDAENGNYKEYEGVLEWISDKAEFTPKTIQTKDERQNQVYAIKVSVQNDGYLKIGMYGEIIFPKHK